MNGLIRNLLFLSMIASPAVALSQSMQLSISNQAFEVVNVLSDVDVFEFSIEIDEPLAVGVFENPPIVNVTYRVMGTLVEGTPSDFPAFALEREISGEEFYAQGSSLQFEISATSALEDGVQVAELAGSDLVFRFDGREIDNGRFHPALFELRADGTGRIQNSNNVPTLDPLLEIESGSEYINDLFFDPGNTTIITAIGVDPDTTSGGGGSISLTEIVLSLLFFLIVVFQWRTKLNFN